MTRLLLETFPIYFCFQFWHCQGCLEKSWNWKNSLNFKSNKMKNLTSIHSNYQSPNIVSKIFVSLLQSEKYTAFHMQNCSWWLLVTLMYPSSNNCLCHMKSNDRHQPHSFNKSTISLSKFLVAFWMFTHLSTILYFCNNPQMNVFFLWLTNPNGTPLNQTQLFSSHEIHNF
jgi:hypothetical protein